MADERALWRSIATPVAVDAAANIHRRLIGVRQRIIENYAYAGLPLGPYYMDPSQSSWLRQPLLGDVHQLCHPMGQPFVLAAFVSLSPSHYALSTPTLAGDTMELTALAVRPTHCAYHDDYSHLLANLAKLTGQPSENWTSLVLKFRHPFSSAAISDGTTHDAIASFPAYDMHDHRMDPWEHRSRLCGADVVVHFTLSQCQGGLVKQYFGDIVNVTVVVPPVHTWPVTPRVFGRKPSNPYPINDPALL